VNRSLTALLAENEGVVSRGEVLARMPHHVLDHAVRTGAVLRIFPRVYVDPARAGEWWTQARAAVRYAGRGAALSHLTALRVWNVPGPHDGAGNADAPVHVLVPASQRPRAAAGVVVHRRRGFDPTGPGVVVRRGEPVCRVEQAAVDSWPLLPRDARRAAVIASVGERLTTPARLRAAAEANINLPGRLELLRLVNLLDLGCRSELELWGYERVFTGPDMPRLVRNVRVRVGTRSVYLDVYCPRSRVNFELDGAKWHHSAAARERDARRDAELAAMGIMVVRFTHDQLVFTPDVVRAQVRAIVAARLSGAAAGAAGPIPIL
jgi:hypothetical protein